MWKAPQASAARPSSTRSVRQSTARDSSAPYCRARAGTSCTCGSSYWPMSAVYVHGTAPFSRIHATATDVSSPPEKAMPTRSPTGRETRTFDIRPHATRAPVAPAPLPCMDMRRSVYSCAMNERHRLIAVIIDLREVTSQQQLVELLAEQGVAVTQATVSRDLDRLGAVRVRRNGHMVYALPEGDEPIDPQELLRQVLG